MHSTRHRYREVALELETSVDALDEEREGEVRMTMTVLDRTARRRCCLCVLRHSWAYRPSAAWRSTMRASVAIWRSASYRAASRLYCTG